MKEEIIARMVGIMVAFGLGVYVAVTYSGAIADRIWKLCASLS